MKFTNKRIESARGQVIETEQRIARQRRRIEKLLIERQPTDEAQAQLDIMEQSLLAKAQFLAILERDLADELSLQRRQTHKRIEAETAAALPARELEHLAEDFAARATELILMPSEGPEDLENLAKALRSLAAR